MTFVRCEWPDAAETSRPVRDPDGVEVDVPDRDGQVGCLRHGEQAHALDDDDRRRLVARGAVVDEAGSERSRHERGRVAIRFAVRGRVRVRARVRTGVRRQPRGLQEERPRTGVDDLVGRQRATPDERAASGRGADLERGGRGVGQDGDVPPARVQLLGDHRRDRPSGFRRSLGIVLAGQRSGLAGRGVPLDKPADRGDDSRGALDDLLYARAGNDQPVVLEEDDRGRDVAGSSFVVTALVVDPARKRQARIGVRNPQRVVTEELGGELPATGRAGQCVDGRRVGVDHDPLRQEGMKHELDRRPALIGGVQAGSHADLQDLFAARQRGDVRSIDDREECLHGERHERGRSEGRERNAARLDVQHPVRLAGAVPAAAAAECRIAAEVARQGGDLGQQLDRRTVRPGSGGLDHRRP